MPSLKAELSPQKGVVRPSNMGRLAQTTNMIEKHNLLDGIKRHYIATQKTTQNAAQDTRNKQGPVEESKAQRRSIEEYLNFK